MKHLIAIIGTGLLLNAGLLLAGDENQLDNLTIDQAIALAESNDPALAASRALVEARESSVRTAGALPNPRLIAGVESASLKGKTSSEAEYLAGVSQTVPLGRRRGKAKAAGERAVAVQQASVDLRRKTLTKRVRDRFATALYQEQAHNAQSKLVVDLRQAADMAKVEQESGDALISDTAAIEVAVAKANLELKRIDRLHRVALIELQSVLGVSNGAVVSLKGDLDQALEMPVLQSLVEGLGSHPAVALAESEVLSKFARVDLAAAERIPDIEVEVLYRREQETDRNGLDIGLSIPLPIFDSGKSKLNTARAELRAAEARARAARQDAQLELREAHGHVSSALAIRALLKEEIMPKAQLIVNVSQARYEAGDISLRELLPVRRDWQELQMTYLESLREVVSAWNELSPFLGR